MEVKVLKVAGWEPSIRGLRNPMNSWDKSDSETEFVEHITPDGFTVLSDPYFSVGPEDLKLMQNLFAAGPEHRKYDRMLIVWMDITASHIFWQEFDTYKVGTVRNSCSKMHKIHVMPFEYDDFAHEGLDELAEDGHVEYRNHFIYGTHEHLESLRKKFNETHDKKYWKALLESLPMGFKLKATVMMSYEVAVNMINQRENHKWYEWHEFIPVLKGLPYMEEIRAKAVEKKEADQDMKYALKLHGIESPAQLHNIMDRLALLEEKLNERRTD